MTKVGRNDPCPCGSGKKYKQCCLLHKGGSGVKRKLTAKWLNPKTQQEQGQKEEINLMDRAFGNIASGAHAFKPVMPEGCSEGGNKPSEAENQSEQ